MIIAHNSRKSIRNQYFTTVIVEMFAFSLDKAHEEWYNAIKETIVVQPLILRR